MCPFPRDAGVMNASFRKRPKKLPEVAAQPETNILSNKTGALAADCTKVEIPC